MRPILALALAATIAAALITAPAGAGDDVGTQAGRCPTIDYEFPRGRVHVWAAAIRTDCTVTATVYCLRYRRNGTVARAWPVQPRWQLDAGQVDRRVIRCGPPARSDATHHTSRGYPDR